MIVPLTGQKKWFPLFVSLPLLLLTEPFTTISSRTVRTVDTFTNGERVQFFRLEAGKDRFMEKVEKVQSDMLRCIKSWGVTRDAWTQRAAHFTKESLHGNASFALQQADMLQKMIERMKPKMYSTGYGHL